jgi:arabinogalactan oligomer/maltooligosaccharide transport system substrate-binding protein
MRLRWLAAVVATMLVTAGCGVFTRGANEPFRVSEPHSGSSPAGTAFGVLTGKYQPESVDLRHFDEARLLRKYWGGKLLAVAEIPQYVVKTFVKPNVILPMTTYLKDLSPSSFYPAVWSAGVESGTRYRLGGNVRVNLLIYNKGLFAKAGITQIPTTWSALTTDLHAVSNPGDAVLEVAPDAGFIESALLSNGGQLPRNAAPDAFDNSAGQETFSYFRGLASQGLLKLSTDAQMESDMATGKVAVIAATSPTYDRVVKEAQQNHISLGAFAIPAGSSGHTANVVGGQEFAMFAHHTAATTQQEWNFIQWLDAPTQQAYYVSQTGYGPVGPQVWSLVSQTTMDANPSLSVTQAALSSPYTVSQPGVSGYGQVAAALGTAFAKAMSGQMSVSQALASVDAAVRSDL